MSDMKFTIHTAIGTVEAPVIMEWRPFGSADEWTAGLAPSNIAVEIRYRVTMPSEPPKARPAPHEVQGAFERVADAAMRAVGSMGRRGGKTLLLSDITVLAEALNIDVVNADAGSGTEDLARFLTTGDIPASVPDAAAAEVDAALERIGKALEDLGKSREHIRAVQKRLRRLYRPPVSGSGLDPRPGYSNCDFRRGPHEPHEWIGWRFGTADLAHFCPGISPQNGLWRQGRDCSMTIAHAPHVWNQADLVAGCRGRRFGR